MRAILWFTKDLRLQDNPALNGASENCDQIIPVYIHDDSGDWQAGGASQWWLHQSLEDLSEKIKAAGGRLILRSGDMTAQLKSVLADTKAEAIYFNRAYEPGLAKAQETLNKHCQENNIECKRFNGRLLFNPDSIETKTGNRFKVYTPFYKHCRQYSDSLVPKTKQKIELHSARVDSDDLKDWQLLPTKPNWAKGFEKLWRPGNDGAHQRLQHIKKHVADYDEKRDIPSVDGTSRLSPHLHFGEISPRQVWHALIRNDPSNDFERAETFLKELVWREFSYYQLHHWPHITDKPFKEKFANFPWKRSKKNLQAWQQGQTGYPLVDAGMRQLWQTGWMHNRVRMVVASFLTKHLRIHWHQGAEWFWDTLVDADMASNSASWQWVSGSGADAAPFFRIFNPSTQAEKFDPEGEYIKTWVPELKDLPKKYIHQPWTADEETLKKANIELDKDYPCPIVEHKAAREEALEAYEAVKSA